MTRRPCPRQQWLASKRFSGFPDVRLKLLHPIPQALMVKAGFLRVQLGADFLREVLASCGGRFERSERFESFERFERFESKSRTQLFQARRLLDSTFSAPFLRSLFQDA